MNARWIALLLAVGSTLAPLPVAAQQAWRAGTSTVPGGVAYSMSHSAGPVFTGLSLRRSVPGGRWNSVKLLLSREAPVPGTARLSVRTKVAQELFKSPYPTIVGAELRWRVAHGLSLSAGLRRAVLPSALYRRGSNLTFGIAWRG